MLATLKEDLESQMESIEDHMEELDLKITDLKLLPQYPGNGGQSQREDMNTSRLSRNTGFAKKDRRSKNAKVVFES